MKSGKLPLAMLLIALAFGVTVANAAKYKAAAVEVVQLPQFCWAQYMDNMNGPQYTISPKLCGVFMNHYCPGLVDLIRARNSLGSTAKLKERLAHLRSAENNTGYTLRGMKDYPHCPIRSHVEATAAEIVKMRSATERMLLQP